LTFPLPEAAYLGERQEHQMTRLSVPDMNCGHCKASVEAALTPLGARVSVDLPARQVDVEGIAPEAAIKALDAVGFPATVAG